MGLQAVREVTPRVRTGLTAICGEENLAPLGDVLSVAPGNVRELSAVMKLASEAGLRVHPRGAGTKTARMGDQVADLIVTTQRMNAVSEHVWQDMTCTVGAGCSWAELQRALSQHGQLVALDPLWPDAATVGGIVAANDSGALRLAYGGLRDLVLGMTIVLADGTIARSGGKVVKNVAGYDLHKLMCGAFGTLGVIAEVTFRLHSLPLHVRTYSLQSASVKPLHNLLMRLLDSPYSVQSMQIRVAGEGFALDVRLAALPQVLDTQSDSLNAMAETAGLKMESAAESVWAERQRLLEKRGAVAFKATMLPGSIAEVIEAIVQMGGSAAVQATGILYGAVNAANASGLADLCHKLRAAGGSLTYLGVLPAGVADRWGITPDVLRWMKELKRQLDPEAILNPQCYEAGV